jgi:hypothetical protein
MVFTAHIVSIQSSGWRRNDPETAGPSQHASCIREVVELLLRRCGCVLVCSLIAAHRMSAEAQQTAPTPAPAVTADSGKQPQVPAREPLNPTQEIAGEQPEGNALEVGPARLRIGGYLGLNGLYRSTNSGGGPGTAFATRRTRIKWRATYPRRASARKCPGCRFAWTPSFPSAFADCPATSRWTRSGRLAPCRGWGESSSGCRRAPRWLPTKAVW